MSNKDYYAVLGVDRTASEDELKKAYRTLSKKYHPDLQQGKSDKERKSAEERFKEINEAYSVLGDKDKRERYDRLGSGGFEEEGFGPGGFDPMDFFRRHFHNGFGDFGFGFDFDGGHRRRKDNPDSPKNGRDIEIGLEISFNEALYGTTREFDIRFDETCQKCKGTGAADSKTDTCPECSGNGMVTRIFGTNQVLSTICPRCRGEGTVPQNPCPHCGGKRAAPVEHHIKIHISAGVGSGSTLRVHGKGEHGLNGGMNGDLYVNLKVSGCGLFSRNEMDLMTTVYVPSICIGAQDSVEVCTPWGDKTVKIPAKMRDDGTFLTKLDGFGVRKTDKHGNAVSGDLYVRIVPEPIQNMTDKQMELRDKLVETLDVGNTPMKQGYSKAVDAFKSSASKFRH